MWLGHDERDASPTILRTKIEDCRTWDTFRFSNSSRHEWLGGSDRTPSAHFGRRDELGDAGARRRRARAIPSHSARSAITGSILVARRAGKHDAHSVTSSRKTDSAR